MFLSKNLKYLKNLNKIKSNKELGKFCNIPNRTLEDIIYNNSDPKISTIINISIAFSIKIDDLIFKDLSNDENIN